MSRLTSFLQLVLWQLWLLLSVALLRGCIGSDDFPLELSDDVLGLIVFKSDIQDPLSSLSSWNEDDASPCSWQHVGCNPSTGRVSEISLEGLGLSGRIGRGLEKLQHLKVLSLAWNNFSGNIGSDYGFISSLQMLNLSHNSLSGHIPTPFVNMSSIKFVDVSHNLLSGPVPDGLFYDCQSLRHLSLAGNLFEGPIPSTLSRCSNLNSLDLSKNGFSGGLDFTSEIWSFKRLRTLDLSENSLSGQIPQGISALHNLKELLLQGNQFSGPLPVDIGLCPHLNRVEVGGNLLSGNLPESLGRLDSLAYFSLSNNMLSGDFPQWIGNVSSVEHIDLSNNALTGTLPLSIGKLNSLSYLSLSNNKLGGSVPESLAYCPNLSVIKLRGNSFRGRIPEGLFDMNLEEVDLSHNQLVGSIPSGSSKFYAVIRWLDLSRNNFIGDIPANIGHTSSLKYLNLSWNNLQSLLIPGLGQSGNLTVLDLRNNSLYGSIPRDICNTGSLRILQLDENLLTGPIPNEIGKCSSLDLLSLSHNNLNGSVPESLSMLNQLKILKLEYNDLSGELPRELGKLGKLLAVNISYNRLVGRLPAGIIFQNLDESALQGNLGICSPLLKGPCTLNVPKPLVINPFGNQVRDHNKRNASSNSIPTHQHRILSVSAIVAILAAVFIVFGVLVVSLLNASVRRNIALLENALESMCSSSSRSGSMVAGKFILFNLNLRSSPGRISNPEYLLNKAAEIGEGVFGTVYKVLLGGCDRVVAIKKLESSNIVQDLEDFDHEVRILGKAAHPNLIAVKGYFWTPQLQLLVTDYAPNGSLQSKLHERNPSIPPLSWAIRFKIMLGTAKGLAYLHHSCSPPIIHYNIKPSNILLDENYNPKISDFGLARLLTKLEKHVMSNRFQSALGYVAPELACQSLRVNEKCDVYGFGVMILELVTGRRPVEYGEDNVMILSDHVKILLEQGNVLDCVDPSLTEYPEDEVLPVLKLALVCTSQIPSSRPSMSDVVQILQVIKTPVPERLEFY